MKEIPEYIQKATLALLTPFFGEKLTAERIVRGIELAAGLAADGAGKPMPLGVLANQAGLAKNRLRRLLRNAEVAPCGKGGKTGREELYRPDEVLAAVTAARGEVAG